MNNTGAFIYQVCEWFMRLAIANLLWIFFTLLGGFFLGIYPASAACTALLHCWMEGKRPAPVPFFWKTYKRSFTRANALFLPALIAVSLLMVNLYTSLHFEGVWFYLFVSSTAVFLLALGLFLLLALLPLSEEKAWKTVLIKTFRTLFLYPGLLCFLVGGIIILGACIRVVPGILPLYSVNIVLLMNIYLFSLSEKKDSVPIEST
ncbi:YesL family protein [Alteribacillus bidgolensis]|uniref:Uncharacterized membrane protein YesL n=1 Tax=Alteribacillus bidgolensis TaxID=930129 RepID=A0A1G8MIA0_9BACI|nr:DUF624 domain-containing protein [Alteribacillus bidgolensis]SDI67577.1 Uncharacterized membrane protein YesL [Alteribacillus bidgolensis]